MKCQNCTGSISTEFSHAFLTNTCPKCGKELMKKDAKFIFGMIQGVLKKPGKDIGDVSIFLADFYNRSDDGSLLVEDSVSIDDDDEDFDQPVSSPDIDSLNEESPYDLDEEPEPQSSQRARERYSNKKVTRSNVNTENTQLSSTYKIPSAVAQASSSALKKLEQIKSGDLDTIVSDIQSAGNIDMSEQSMLPLDNSPLSQNDLYSVIQIMDAIPDSKPLSASELALNQKLRSAKR